MTAGSLEVARRRMSVRDSFRSLGDVDVIPAANPTIGIHVLLWKRDYREAIWAIASILAQTEPGPSVTIHINGQLPETALETLQEIVVGATVLTDDLASEQIRSVLADARLDRLLHFRDRDPLARKVIDVLALATTPTILYFDSDVLFFARPVELFDSVSQSASAAALRFMNDTNQSTVISVETARSLGLSMMPMLNSGLLRVHRDSIDLEKFEHWLGIDQVANGGYFTEQTLWALMAANVGATPLSSRYVLGDSPPCDSPPIAIHYTSPTRALFYDVGIPTLIANGIVERLRSRSTTPLTGPTRP